jgi:hypothetical protein
MSIYDFDAKAYQKEMLPSDKMSDEEYAKEDMSNMDFLADAYRANGGGTGKTFIWVNNLINQMIDEIKRDPRTYGKMPKELLNHGTINERNYLKKKLSELDPVDMRNKIERIMTKPVENPYSKVTYNEMKAFELFIDLSRNFQANKYEKSDMRTYFEFQDKIYKGHREIRNLDKKRESFNGNVPPEFEKEYQQKLADIVIKAPQIFFELPSDIRENYSPDNHFYEALNQQKATIQEKLRFINQKDYKGDELTHDDKLFKDMVNEIAKYEDKKIEYMNEMKSQALHNDDPGDYFDDAAFYGDTGEEFPEPSPEAHPSIHPEDFSQGFEEPEFVPQPDIPFVPQSDIPNDFYVEDYTPLNIDDFDEGIFDTFEGFQPLTTEEIEAYQKEFGNMDAEMAKYSTHYSPEQDYVINMMSPEESTFYGEDLASVPYYSITEEELAGNYEDKVVVQGKEEDLFDPRDDNAVEKEVNATVDKEENTPMFGKTSEIVEINQAAKDWEELTSKDSLTEDEFKRVSVLEKEIAEKVADDISLYSFVAKPIANPVKLNSAFYDRLFELLKEDEITDFALKGDMAFYRVNKASVAKNPKGRGILFDDLSGKDGR